MTAEDANLIAVDPTALKPVVLRFRFLIEESRAVAKSLDSLAIMQNFPKGCCKPASMLLAHHLSTTHRVPKDLLQFCANGVRRGRSHIWFRIGQINVDITSDQFEDCPHSVVVTRQNEDKATSRL